MSIILIVEDEPTTRTLMCQILEPYECHAVRSAEEGLELLVEVVFDVVITDVKLPGMDGDEFLRAARELRPSMPVIVMSGGYGYDEARYVEAGAFAYLLKPFRVEELKALVARALGGGEV